MHHNMTDYDETVRSFKLNVPEYYNFGFDVIDKWAEKDSEKVALIWLDTDGETEKKYTFTDLKKMSAKFANVLKNSGYKKGDRLYVMVPRIPDWYAVLLGCFKLGVIPMPAPKILQPMDIQYRLDASGAKGAVIYVESYGKITHVDCSKLESRIIIGADNPPEGWESYEKLMDEASDELSREDVEETHITDSLIIYFTSGTTKNPRMVLHDQTYAVGHEITARFWQDLTENDLHWTLSDTGWGKAVWGKLFGQWIIGAKVLMYNAGDGFAAKTHLAIMEKMGVTSFCAPPTAYKMLLLQDLSKYDFSKLRHSLSAGEPLNPEVIRKWKEYTGTTIYDGYGQTETVNTVANYFCLEVRHGSMGKPTPGFTVDILDDECTPMPIGEPGNIAIRYKPERPMGLFREYYLDKEGTEAAFRGDWYFTGDKAYKDEDGYFWFVGRADDIIKTAGFRVGPFEVESVLHTHDSVAECAVIGVADKDRGTAIKAFIILKPGYEASNKLAREIQSHVKTQTAQYKCPKIIEFVEELPKTVSGKIRRVELRDKENKNMSI